MPFFEGGHHVLNKHQSIPRGCPLKTRFTGRYNLYFVVGDTIVLLLGAASITETSCQTVDSGQVEDTRWSEVSSDVVKVNYFF